MNAIAITAGLLTLSACSPPGFTVSTGPQETTITGEFGGEPRGDSGCAWIQTSSAERVEVTYQNNWRLEFDPPALFDQAGRLRATAGDTLTVVGYFEDVGASICQPQRAFLANDVSVEPASPSPP